MYEACSQSAHYYECKMVLEMFIQLCSVMFWQCKTIPVLRSLPVHACMYHIIIFCSITQSRFVSPVATNGIMRNRTIKINEIFPHVCGRRLGVLIDIGITWVSCLFSSSSGKSSGACRGDWEGR